MAVAVTAASVQDRDGGRPLLWKLAAVSRTVTLIWADGGYAGKLVTWADGGYAGKLVTWAASTLRRTVQIVKRPDNLQTFTALPRPLGGGADLRRIMKHRRCVRDYERLLGPP